MLDDARILLFGAGGHAKSVIAVARAEGRWHPVGLIEDAPTVLPRRVLGCDVLGTLDLLPSIRASGIDKAFVAVGDNPGRARIAAAIEAAGFTLVSIAHPNSVNLSEHALQPGCFVHAFVVIGPECRIGRNAIIQPHSSLGHESVIGDNVHFSPGVRIGGKARIGDGCFFGPGAVIYPRVAIGDNVSIGANCVVNKDVPDGCLIVGGAGRVVKRQGDGSA